MPDQILNQDANFWVAVGTGGLFLATAALVVVGWRQLRSIRVQNAEQIEAQRLENIKWKTIDACNTYDRDPIIHECLIKTFNYHNHTIPTNINQKDLKVYVTTILNYLDSIAIGLAQGVYDEAIVRDHMEPIFKKHVSQYLSSREKAADYGLEIDNFSHVVELEKRLREAKTTYKPQAQKEH